MADESEKPAAAVDISPELLQRVARELSAGAGPARKAPGANYSLTAHPVTQAFNKLGAGDGVLPSRLPFMGTSPITYTSYRGNDGLMHQDGKRGIEYQVEGTDVRLLAGSYQPDRNKPGVEHWTAAVAWTPINMGGLKLGPIVGDTARSDMRDGASKPFERVGLTAGLYMTAEDKDGGVFAKIENDPATNGKPRVFVGLKLPFNGQ